MGRHNVTPRGYAVGDRAACGQMAIPIVTSAWANSREEVVDTDGLIILTLVCGYASQPLNVRESIENSEAWHCPGDFKKDQVPQ